MTVGLRAKRLLPVSGFEWSCIVNYNHQGLLGAAQTESKLNPLVQNLSPFIIFAKYVLKEVANGNFNKF